MSTDDERITPEVVQYVLQARIAFWRGQARTNLRLGFLDLARVCETQASALEWEVTPCES